MASIRPIKLAKYFSQFGHDVTVLTSLQNDNWCQQELEPTYSSDIKEIYAAPHWGMKYLTMLYGKLKERGQRQNKAINDNPDLASMNCETSKSNKFAACIKRFLSWAFYYSADRLENYFLAQGLIKAAKREKLKGFDIVIATYPGAGVHVAGEWFKKKKITKRFIADYRDPAYNPGGRSNKIEQKHDKHVQNRAIKYADAVVCVSQGMADNIKAQYPASKLPPVYVVRNGFDSEDNVSAISANLDTEKFNFVYTGALYQGRRTVDILARVIKELVDEGFITVNDIAINYAGPDFEELKNQLRPYGIEAAAVDYGYVSRAQSLGMQMESDMVLLLNWNDDNYTGVIPGKLYEYMSSHKPILALIMGNKSGSESARMIADYGLGCACEQALPEDLSKLKHYLIQTLSNFKDGVREDIACNKISAFEYKNIAQRYLNVIAMTS